MTTLQTRSRRALSFTVPGDPRPKVTHGRFPSKDSKQYEGEVWLAARRAKHSPWPPGSAFATMFDGPVELTVRFYLRMPKKPKDDLPIVRPDLKNLIANVEDALTLAGVWKDDSQVVAYGVGTGKYYADTPAGPRAEIEVRPY